MGTDCIQKHLFPDIKFDCINYQLIVEIDEFKHRGSAYRCDEQRMLDIIAKLGQPCIFIRYNPDNKKSNLNILLDEINIYLVPVLNGEIKSLDEYNFNSNSGLMVKYLFYDN